MELIATLRDRLLKTVREVLSPVRVIFERTAVFAVQDRPGPPSFAAWESSSSSTFGAAFVRAAASEGRVRS